MTKVLIVDDEMLMRKGLCTLIDWEKLDCQVIGAVENGLLAQQSVLAQPPDIIISDIKMPVVDGLALAKWVNETHPHIRMILLTAFADFTYAKQAIQYGVTDYVTKTGDMGEIITAVSRCKEQLQRQSALRDDRRKQAGAVLKSILDGSLHTEQEISRQAKLVGLSAAVYQLAVVDTGAARPQKQQAHSMRKQAETMFSSFLPREKLYLISNGPSELYLVFLDIPEQQVHKFCMDSIAMFQKLTAHAIYFGVSSSVRSLFGLPAALMQARQALSERFYDKRELHTFHPSEPAKTPTYAAQFAALSRSMKSGDQDACCAILSELAASQRQTHQPQAQVKETARMILHLCRSTLESYGLDLDALDIDETQWKRDLECTQFHQICTQMQQILICAVCQCIAQMLTEGGNLLADVQAYIDGHFCEPITLKDLAAAVHVSAGYLSRYFRQKTGKTIMDTITRKKIAFAKQLIEEGNLKIFEIAQRVAFEDTTYFSHVFKKYAGVSAKTYQEQIQRRRSNCVSGK